MKNTYFNRLSCLVILLFISFTSLAQDQFPNVINIEAGEGYRLTPLLGDYDGDGDMDILGTGDYTRNARGSKASILLRNDNGEFVAVDHDFPTFYSGGMFLWADVDNDNDLDVIAGGCTSTYCYNSKRMSIYRNDGNDQFTLIDEETTNLSGGVRFSLVDFNNDGLIDIEIARQSDNNSSVIGRTFYKNTGNFVFEETWTANFTIGVPTIWGDFDNDGWLDIVLYNQAYKNLRDGTFELFEESTYLLSSTRHYVFDVDNDGNLDLITHKGELLSGDGNGQFTYTRRLIFYDYILSLVTADFNGDGHMDMAVTGGKNSKGINEWFMSNGDGTFTAEDLHDQIDYYNTLTVADIDNDNDPDILYNDRGENGLAILENGNDTELSSPTAPSNLQSSFDNEKITFAWDAASDNEQTSLKYNLYLLYDEHYNIIPNADITTGKGFRPGTANVPNALQKELFNSGLSDGYYRWSVQSVDAELNRSVFAEAQELTYYADAPANAPTELALTTVDDQSVALTWTDNSDDETSFTIERSAISGNTGFEVLDDVVSNTTSFTDNTAAPRTLYFYRIRLDGSAEVAYSNVIQVTTEANILFNPTNLSATAINSASIQLDWNYTESGITGFVIERSDGDKNNFETIGTTGSDDRTYVDQAIESGSNYYYRISAANGDEVSEYSEITVITAPMKAFEKYTLSSLWYEYRYIMGAIAWGDYDNDGFDDLFIGYKAQLFHNEGDGTFRKISNTNIVSTIYGSNDVASWGDYDNDGFLDLFYYNDEDNSAIYRGHGDGSFTKTATTISGNRDDIRNATWTDMDMDGDLDLSISGGRYIYRYDGNDKFTLLVYSDEQPSPYYYTSIASWSDYDDDGDPDVFLGNRGDDEFFNNNGDGTFTAVKDERITEDYNFDCCSVATPTALWADFNNDTKMDLTVFHSEGPIFGYVNNGSSFDSAFYSNEHNRLSWKNLFWVDFDNDGDLDFFLMGQYNIRTEIWENKDGQLIKLKGGPLYDYVSSDANFSWNDFDNDGYNDLFKFDINHQVYKNVSNGNSWIKIRLRGRTSNSTGLGAKVYVKANDQWQRSDVSTHHSNRVQQGFMSLFGLGNATQVDSVKVIWPSGNRQYLKDIAINQVVLMDEDDAQETVTPPPSNLLAEVLYPSKVALTWTDRSENETGFVIEMKADDGEFTAIGSVGANVTTYTAEDLSFGINYKFRVRTSDEDQRWTNQAEAEISLFTEVFAGDLTTYTTGTKGMSWGDPDGDGDPDLFFGSESFEPDAVYYNENGLFTRTYLTDQRRYSKQAQWVDYNNDGYLDLHVSIGGGVSASDEYLHDALYKNDGTGQLIEQEDHLLSQDGSSDYVALWGDINDDGLLDMITTHGTLSPVVYLNKDGDMSSQYTASSLTSFTNGVLFDMDGDRDLDILSTGYSYSSPVFSRNDGGRFTTLTSEGPSVNATSFVLEDFDNDGNFDMLVLDQNRELRLFLFNPFSYDYEEVINAFPDIGNVYYLATGDFDNNGYRDILAMGQVNYSGNSNRIFMNDENLNFTALDDPILEKTLQGAAIADVNKDGNLDMIMITRESYYTKRKLLQANSNDNHWLRIRLKGKNTNQFGIGARIYLFTSDGTQVRDVRSGPASSYSDEQTAHFGLGDQTSIDYILVQWPSGTNQWIAHPDVDQEMVVQQSSSSGPTKPSAPTNLTASMDNSRAITLEWSDNSDDESQFRIERALGSGSFINIGGVISNITSYTDLDFVSSRDADLTIKYRVIAVNEYKKESNPSNEARLNNVVTGLEELDQRSIVIYPQPASAKVFIKNEHEIFELSLIDLHGKVLTEMTVPRLKSIELPLGKLRAGLYFLQITDVNGTHLKKIAISND